MTQIFAYLFPVIVLVSCCMLTVDSHVSVQPNIVFILTDDLGWNDVGFHGYAEIPTPNIYRLANEGVIMNSHYSMQVCSPSRMALLTAKYPFRLGMQGAIIWQAEPRGLTLNEKLLPQYMKDLGYKTHLVGKWHLGYHKPAYTPTRRGFDSFFGFHGGNLDYFNYTSTDWIPPAYHAYDLFEGTSPQWQFLGRYATDVFTERAVELIHTHDTENPFFLYFAHAAPHFANGYDPIQATEDLISRFSHIRHIGRRKYAANMASLDISVGEVYDALEAKAILNNTVIVFASDNGAGSAPLSHGSNYPLRGQKGTAWEGSVRSTSFVWSRLLQKPSRVSSELYHFCDWVPTFYALGGGASEDLPKNLDGHDIWKSISDDLPSPREEAVIQINQHHGTYALRWHQYKVVIDSIIREANATYNSWYKPVDFHSSLIVSFVGALSCDDTVQIPCDPNVSPCLLDVIADPCEYVNLAEDEPSILKLLLDKLNVYNETAVYPQQILPIDPLAQSYYTNGSLSPWLPDDPPRQEGSQLHTDGKAMFEWLPKDDWVHL